MVTPLGFSGFLGGSRVFSSGLFVFFWGGGLVFSSVFSGLLAFSRNPVTYIVHQPHLTSKLLNSLHTQGKFLLNCQARGSFNDLESLVFEQSTGKPSDQIVVKRCERCIGRPGIGPCGLKLRGCALVVSVHRQTTMFLHLK